MTPTADGARSRHAEEEEEEENKKGEGWVLFLFLFLSLSVCVSLSLSPSLAAGEKNRLTSQHILSAPREIYVPRSHGERERDTEVRVWRYCAAQRAPVL